VLYKVAEGIRHLIGACPVHLHGRAMHASCVSETIHWRKPRNHTAMTEVYGVPAIWSDGFAYL
jgi:hypothetical protein